MDWSLLVGALVANRADPDSSEPLPNPTMKAGDMEIDSVLAASFRFQHFPVPCDAVLEDGQRLVFDVKMQTVLASSQPGYRQLRRLRGNANDGVAIFVLPRIGLLLEFLQFFIG